MTTDRLNTLLQLVKENPEDTFVLFAIAQEYKQAADFSTAITWYNKLRKVDGNYIGLYYHLADAYAQSGDSDAAFSTYEQGVRIAREINDQHALSELLNARINLEMELL